MEGPGKVMKSGNPAAISALDKGDLANARVAATPGGIEAQEKAGQTALVNSTHMPKKLQPSREAFEAIGFKFGADVDELFMEATLPPGWKREATGHSMHSDILDDQGRKRVGVFYKAAFYDRRADAYLNRRYCVQILFPDEDRPNGLAKDEIAYVVKDGDAEIFRTAVAKSQDWKADEALRQVAIDWLAERQPDHADPTACW